MSKAVLVLLATTVGLGLVSMHLVRELRAQREQARALQTRLTELERDSRRLPPATGVQTAGTPFVVVERSTRTADNTELQGVLRKAGDAAPKPGDANRAPRQLLPEDVMRQMRESHEQQRALLQDPEYRDALRTQARASQAQIYPDLAQELELSADEADQFMNLLADQQVRAQEIGPTMWSDGAPDPAALEELQRQGQQQHQENESEQANLLGPDKFQAWKNYQSTLGVRHEVSSMRSMFAGKGVPIQESQFKPLLKALAQEQQRAMKEWSEQARNAGGANVVLAANAMFVSGNGMMVASGDPATDGDQLVKAQQQQLEMLRKQSQRRREAIADILTPQQLKAFDQDQSAQLKMQEAQIRLMRAQSQAQSGSR